MVTRTGQNDGADACARGDGKEIDQFLDGARIQRVALFRAVQGNNPDPASIGPYGKVLVARSVDLDGHDVVLFKREKVFVPIQVKRRRRADWPRHP
jgi:hypothetical protein